jgi:uncharacterized protein
MCAHLKPSRYNRVVKHGNRWLLFNGVSSALMQVEAVTMDKLRPVLSDKACCSLEDLKNSGLQQFADPLLKGHYLVEECVNELEFLRERFRSAQFQDPVTVTIATTLDCNLGCYYCYEERDRTYLNTQTCGRIFDHVAGLMRTSPDKKLYVSWYGGEPMMNSQAIEYLSEHFLRLCDDNGYRYCAHMVSNGTCWPDSPDACVDFVTRHKIKHVQFTFDGLHKNHNNRRHYLKVDPSQPSSFETLCKTVNSLVGKTAIYLRLNVDRGNISDAYRLVDFFSERGWLFPGSNVYPYVAPLLPHTDACSSVGKTALAHDSINMFQMEFLRYLSKYCDLREFLNMNYYPRTVRLLCGAVASRAVLFGPEGRVYKCVYDLGVHSLSHGAVGQYSYSGPSPSHFRILNDLAGNKAAPSHHDYMNYDPCSNPSCSVCEYLPICMGGCPKTQIEKDKFYTDEFKRYWDANLDILLRTFADMQSKGPVASLPSLNTPFGPEAMATQTEREVFGIN